MLCQQSEKKRKNAFDSSFNKINVTLSPPSKTCIRSYGVNMCVRYHTVLQRVTFKGKYSLFGSSEVNSDHPHHAF